MTNKEFKPFNPLGIWSLAVWPFLNLYNMRKLSSTLSSRDDKIANQVPPSCKPYPNSFEDYVAPFAILLCVSACAAPFYYSPENYEPAQNLELKWMIGIILRDLLVVLGVCGFWDYTLYFSPWAPKLSSFKFNKIYPPKSQFLHDMKFTCCSAVVSSIFEILIFHKMSLGQLNVYFDFWQFPLYSMLWLALMPWWRITHFYLIHRGIHPWKTKQIPDVGKFFYKHVHSLHHLSRNPTAFSGISMHPFESTLYYSALLIPLFFRNHPLLFFVTKFDLTLGAILGHDGFAGVIGHGSLYHWVHHNYVEFNFGDTMIPLDWLFGSFKAH